MQLETQTSPLPPLRTGPFSGQNQPSVKKTLAWEIRPLSAEYGRKQERSQGEVKYGKGTMATAEDGDSLWVVKSTAAAPSLWLKA